MGKAIILKMGTGPGGTHSCVGSIQDDKTGEVVPFQQEYATELGLAVGSKVSYETITTSTTGTLANSLTPLDKGKIKTINGDNQTGTLHDRATKSEIPFDQPYLKEAGIGVDSVVDFTTLNLPAGGGLPAQTLAVSLVLIKS